MPRDLPDSTDPKRWMRRVYSNLARARDLSGVPEVLYEDLCFDVQQAVEKAIKAVLLANGVPFPKTHAIAELVTLLEGNGIPFSEDVRQSVRLTRYAVTARYPGLEEEVTAEEHKRAVELAESVVRWAESQLADQVDPASE